MKLHSKVILCLVPGLMLLYAGSQIYQQWQIRHRLGVLSHESLSQLDELATQNAVNVHASANAAIAEPMLVGEMDKLEKSIRNLAKVKGLLEFTLFDRKGVPTHSSDLSYMKSTLPVDLKPTLLASPEEVVRKTAETIEIYKPHVASPECIECHTDWKVNSIGGVTRFRFSNAEAQNAKNAWALSLQQLERASRSTAAVTLLLMAVVVAGLCYGVVHKLITRPFMKVAEHLEATFRTVRQASRQSQVTSQSLADGATQQAASLEEISASLEEIESSTRKNAQHAAAAKNLAAETREAGDGGVVQMEAMTQAMNEIKEASDNIARILKSINEIAVQTNLLALNASVEAARAGEAGLGFAVVAEEVRNLAQRSAQAAHETESRIQDAMAKSGRGVMISTEMSQSLKGIVAKAHQVDELVASIAGASHDQSQRTTEVNSAVAQMNEVTQQNAARAEESASLAAELNGQAGVLEDAFNELVSLLKGRLTDSLHAVPHPSLQPEPRGSKITPRPAGPAAKPLARAGARGIGARPLLSNLSHPKDTAAAESAEFVEIKT